MATSRWQTAGTLINSAAVECQLNSVVDPFASTDTNFKLFVALLNSWGMEMAQHTPPLQSLLREATLTMSPGDSGVYSLPDDWISPVDQTTWDTAAHWPANFPISDQGWAMLKGIGFAGLSIGVPARIKGNNFETWPQPVTAAASLTLEYVSRAWVQTAAASSPDADSATSFTDKVLYEPLLVIRALKYHWKGEKGKDVTKAKDDYDTALSMAESAGPAPLLNMAGGGLGPHFIDEMNLPITGWGT